MNLDLDGVSQPLEEWARDFGIPVALIRSRLRRGWSVERALTQPMVVRRGEKLPDNAMVDPGERPVPSLPTVAPAPPLPARRRFIMPRSRAWKHKGGTPSKMLTLKGETLSVSQWAARIGITRTGLHMRLARMSVEDALTTPAGQRPGQGQSALTAPA